jgi:hypothetical protein
MSAKELLGLVFELSPSEYAWLHARCHVDKGRRGESVGTVSRSRGLPRSGVKKATDEDRLKARQAFEDTQANKDLEMMKDLITRITWKARGFLYQGYFLFNTTQGDNPDRYKTRTRQW